MSGSRRTAVRVPQSLRLGDKLAGKQAVLLFCRQEGVSLGHDKGSSRDDGEHDRGR